MNKMERFTDRARKALAEAPRVAEKLGHNYVGTEHLLIAVLLAEGVAAKAMQMYGVTATNAAGAVNAVLAPDASPLDQLVAEFQRTLGKLQDLAKHKGPDVT